MQKDSMLQLEDFGTITNQIKITKNVGTACWKDVIYNFNYRGNCTGKVNWSGLNYL